jgi:hypothetical protein
LVTNLPNQRKNIQIESLRLQESLAKIKGGNTTETDHLEREEDSMMIRKKLTKKKRDKIEETE